MTEVDQNKDSPTSHLTSVLIQEHVERPKGTEKIVKSFERKKILGGVLKVKFLLKFLKKK